MMRSRVFGSWPMRFAAAGWRVRFAQAAVTCSQRAENRRGAAFDRSALKVNCRNLSRAACSASMALVRSAKRPSSARFHIARRNAARLPAGRLACRHAQQIGQLVRDRQKGHVFPALRLGHPTDEQLAGAKGPRAVAGEQLARAAARGR